MMVLTTLLVAVSPHFTVPNLGGTHIRITMIDTAGGTNMVDKQGRLKPWQQWDGFYGENVAELTWWGGIDLPC
jgi:hypothetical protein